LRKALASALVVLFLVMLVPSWSPAHAQSLPQVSAKSVYTIDEYGYAIVSESVTYSNNGTSSMQAPPIQIGFGIATPLVTNYNLTGAGFAVSTGTNGNQSVFVVSGGQSIPSGGSISFLFSALIPNVATRFNATTLRVLLVAEPFFNLQLKSLKLQINMPYATQFVKNPECLCAPEDGYSFSNAGLNNFTYFRRISFIPTNSTQERALTQSLLVMPSSAEELFPLKVYSADRVITASANGSPVVEDSLRFENLGTNELTNLTVSPLTSANSQVTVLSTAQPPLFSSTQVTLDHFGISLNKTAIGLPVEAGQNFSITYSYPLATKYYSVVGGVVTISIPQSPPIDTFVDSYTISMSFPPGVNVVEAAPKTLGSVNPFTSGQAKLSYGLSVGWALDGGVPLASFFFIVCLIGLFALRGRTVEEEAPEETATERTSDMIKAFEEKTSLINSLFEEIPSVDPNQLNKAYFDELRSRLDTFRSRALQRLNDVKQKSTTKKFFDLLNQMHETEREVDRAARDMLNLYEQYYTRRTRKDVFDRLQPNYRRRLDRALNQLSDELNTAQREAKLL